MTAMIRSDHSAAGAERPGEALVEVADPGGHLPASEAQRLRDLATAAILELGARGEVRVRIVGDQEMAGAHERFAGEAGTTDVLTFDLAEGGAAGGRPLDVDILVCFDEAARQAKERGHDEAMELLLYVLHGILHCLGHDDHTEAGYARMHAEEDRVLARLGIGPVFARGADQGGSR